jgi:hypothetical protein
MTHNLHYHVSRETVDQTISDKTALLEMCADLMRMQRELQDRSDIMEVDGAKVEDLLVEVAWEIDARAREINEYYDPPQYEPEFTEGYP